VYIAWIIAPRDDRCPSCLKRNSPLDGRRTDLRTALCSRWLGPTNNNGGRQSLRAGGWIALSEHGPGCVISGYASVPPARARVAGVRGKSRVHLPLPGYCSHSRIALSEHRSGRVMSGYASILPACARVARFLRFLLTSVLPGLLYIVGGRA